MLQAVRVQGKRGDLSNQVANTIEEYFTESRGRDARFVPRVVAILPVMLALYTVLVPKRYEVTEAVIYFDVAP